MHEYAKWKDPLRNRRQSALEESRLCVFTRLNDYYIDKYLRASCNGMQILIRSNFVMYLQGMAASLPKSAYKLRTLDSCLRKIVQNFLFEGGVLGAGVGEGERRVMITHLRETKCFSANYLIH